MEESKSARLREQELAVEQAYRRGYHHGLSRAREVLLRLLNEGMPAAAAMELCRVFVEQIILPWRLHAASTSSAPPLFDVEECQRLLRDDKQRQSQRPSE
jgi:glucan phosphorylase